MFTLYSDLHPALRAEYMFYEGSETSKVFPMLGTVVYANQSWCIIHGSPEQYQSHVGW